MAASPRSSFLPCTHNFRVFNPLSRSSSFSISSSRGSIARKKLYQVRATTLKEKDEKVMVEDSFQAKTLIENRGKEMDGEPLTSAPGALEAWVIKIEQSVNILLTESVVKILNALYRDRHYARFFVLETIARVPYFAFISVLHMYESFGWWRRADYLKVHFAESLNEMHHLLIMEELGGNALWFDRFLAQHIAIFYYFMTAFMYALSPRMAYHFSECVEKHAYSTYDKFLKLKGVFDDRKRSGLLWETCTNISVCWNVELLILEVDLQLTAEELKKLPAPQAAINYYMNEDLYMFDEFQTSRAPNSRRPKIENLYDVFVNIRDDEGEHCKTMKACQTHGNLRSPHSILTVQDDDNSSCSVPEVDCEGFVDCLKKSLTSQR